MEKDKKNNAPDFLVTAKKLFDRRDEIGEEAHEKELRTELKKRRFKVIK